MDKDKRRIMLLEARVVWQGYRLKQHKVQNGHDVVLTFHELAKLLDEPIGEEVVRKARCLLEQLNAQPYATVTLTGHGLRFRQVKAEAAGVTSADVDEVWSLYVELIAPKMKRPQKLTSKLRCMIATRIKQLGKDDCLDAIRGLNVSPHHNGENDRGERFLGIQYALRSEDQVRKMLAALDRQEPKRRKGISGRVAQLVERGNR